MLISGVWYCAVVMQEVIIGESWGKGMWDLFALFPACESTIISKHFSWAFEDNYDNERKSQPLFYVSNY